jgi:hypothetical protein
MFDFSLFTFQQIRNALQMIHRGENVRLEVGDSCGSILVSSICHYYIFMCHQNQEKTYFN